MSESENSASPKNADCVSRSVCSKAGTQGEGCASCTSKPEGKKDAFSVQDELIFSAMQQIKYIIFVMSGKGGVGKSSVAVNLAVGLAEQGKKTGLLDVDIHGPSVANLLGLNGGLQVDEGTGKLIPAIFGDKLKVLSMDSLLRDKDTAIIWRGPKKTATIRQFLCEVAWGALDYLIIDSPPGTGDEHLTILKAIPQALCLLVTTPQELSLADVRKAVNFLQYSQANVLGLIENMSGLACPHCGQDIPLFKKGGGKSLADHYRIPFLGAIPLDVAAVLAADKGVPVVLLKGDHPAKTQFLLLAQQVEDACLNGKTVRMSLPDAETQAGK